MNFEYFFHGFEVVILKSALVSNFAFQNPGLRFKRLRPLFSDVSRTLEALLKLKTFVVFGIVAVDTFGVFAQTIIDITNLIEQFAGLRQSSEYLVIQPFQPIEIALEIVDVAALLFDVLTVNGI